MTLPSPPCNIMEFKLVNIVIYLLVVSAGCVQKSTSEPFTFAGISAAIVGGIIAGFDPIRCLRYECCTDSWISTDFTELRAVLDSRLYGQHLVIGPLIKHLKAHAKGTSNKALALSFHGTTGTGKNYVSSMVVEQMFREGQRSKYVHLILATRDFPHEEKLSQYKDKLRDMIETEVAKCAQSVFIFDELDKMPAGLIDTLRSYLGYYEKIGGVDYRRAMFFFLSNTAGNKIAAESLKQWASGRSREEITLKQMENIIQIEALNDADGGLWHSKMITMNLITAFIPFLPLERKHVKQCIEYGLILKGYRISNTIVEEIADELVYYPEEVDIFSAKGCQRVMDKIDIILME